MGSDELPEIVAQASALALVGALVWLLLLGARSIGSLATAVRVRWARWELLDHAERTIDLSPLGLRRRPFVLRQDFQGRCAPTADGNLGTGGALWGGSLELSSFLLHEAANAGVHLGAASVLELGAGLGLTSMAIAAAAHATDGEHEVSPPRSLVLTDGHASVVELCRQNVQANLSDGEVSACGLQVQRLGWGDTDAIHALGPKPFDVILGSDVVYHPAPLPLLLDSILALCGPSTCVVIAYTPRGNVVARQHCDIFFSDLSSFFAEVDTYKAEDLRLSRVKAELLANNDNAAATALSGGGDLSEVGPGCVKVFKAYKGISTTVGTK
jgi:predicted nicotinamide N-methyase